MAHANINNNEAGSTFSSSLEMTKFLIKNYFNDLIWWITWSPIGEVKFTPLSSRFFEESVNDNDFFENYLLSNSSKTCFSPEPSLFLWNKQISCRKSADIARLLC